MSILKSGFPTKGIKLTKFVLFEVLGGPQLWGTLAQNVSIGAAQKSVEYKWSYRIRHFSVLDKLLRLRICSWHRVFPLSCTDETSKRSLCHKTRSSSVIIFNWSSHGLSLVEWNLKKWTLLITLSSSCIRR